MSNKHSQIVFIDWSLVSDWVDSLIVQGGLLALSSFPSILQSQFSLGGVGGKQKK